MKFWKQLLLSIILVGAAAVSWVMLDPGAEKTLQGWGIPVPGMLAADTASGQGQPARQTGSEAAAPAGGAGGGRAAARSALVIVERATTGIVNDRFSAIGTGAPVRTVSVRPQVSGQIADLPIISGAHVDEGSVLARLDSESQNIAVDRARITVANAEQKVSRTDNLLAQRTISSVEADQARSDLDTARLALRQAELDLSQRTVLAPISGTIGILGVSLGDYVTNQTVLAVIDDRDQILIEFHVPERLVGSVQLDSPITASAVARPGDTFIGAISAVDNRLDEASRTLKVQARIENTEDRLRAGMSFEVDMRFSGQSFPSVDPLAVQWDSAGSYVWRVVDSKAERVPIVIVQRNADLVLVNGDIANGDVIVTEGVQNVRSGGLVEIQSETPPPASPIATSAVGKTGSAYVAAESPIEGQTGAAAAPLATGQNRKSGS
ncbi:RND family efflux transporter MFP subunit [Hoeflea marina]|uniref:RND family efflux transporter MFP subunit n=1 Tax=Hoeflea marina TaxID=274592 RepID=A0A317PLN1_9HYPH|nr:efflux RND transporter periplasmic adaptor subunit [Hoeflea marina]PWW01657.1 RND family efflux transporter MFP subunit [Hoeflea marina]